MESAPEVVNIIDTLVIILQGGHADDDWFGAGYCHVHMFTQTVLMMSVNILSVMCGGSRPRDNLVEYLMLNVMTYI